MDITGIIKDKIALLYKTKENFSKQSKISLKNIEKAVCGELDSLSYNEVNEICKALSITLDFCLEKNYQQTLLAVLPCLDSSGTQRVYTSIIAEQNESEKQSRQS